MEDPGATLTCRKCGAAFPPPTPGRQPWHCDACHLEARRLKQQRKDARRQARRLDDAEWMRKPEALELARSKHYLPINAGVALLCAECGQVVARRRGPAKGGWWRATENMDSGCLPGSGADASSGLGVSTPPPMAIKPAAPRVASGPPQRPYIATSYRAVKLG